jgi:multiple sugar transport system substrate-binding protein
MLKRTHSLVAIAILAALVALGAGCGGGGGSGGGTVTVDFWDGQTQSAKKTVDRLVAKFNKTHKGIHVVNNSGGVNADSMLQKVTAGLQAGNYPDVAYIFGSDLANLAATNKLLDLDDAVHSGEIKWNEFVPAAQQAATVDGKIRAFPALIDNLAVVYNKKLFQQAGVPFPKDNWSWNDFAAAAKRLTNNNTGVVGAAWPGTGDEDTTWRIWPMIWQLGGDIVSKDGQTVGFDNSSGTRSLNEVRQMSAVNHSLYIDTTSGSERMQQVFNSGKMAMNIAGPWALPDYVRAHINYGVSYLPSFTSRHTTIAGPDVWAIFDNGSERSQAAIKFVNWFTAPKQNLIWDKAAGSLPTRTDASKQKGYDAYLRSLPHLDKFVANLRNAEVRPTIPQYPEISKAMGQAVSEMLYGKSTPADAIHQAADQGNAALSGSGVP